MLEDVKTFMEASGQTTTEYDEEQVDLYAQLFNEEVVEMNDAWYELQEALAGNPEFDVAKCLDHLLKEISDVLVTAAGFGYSFGLPVAQGLEAVTKSNLAKIIDGKVRLHPETRKVLKPEGWQPPDLSTLVAPIAATLVPKH